MPVKRKRSAKESRAPQGTRSVELLWGSRNRPTRGPKPGLTLDAIVQAAVEVVDTEGLAALTMGRIAAELNVTTMAPYRYVSSKDELIDLMTDAALGAPPSSTGGDWRTEVGHWVRAELAIFCRHPWLLGTIMTHGPFGPNWLGWLEALLSALSATRLNASQKISVVLLVDGHARSTAQNEVGVTSTPQWASNFGRVLQTAIGDDRFSAVAHVAAAGGFERAASDAHFEFGLQRLLDGIDAFLVRRTSQRRSKIGRSRVHVASRPRE